MTDLIVLSLVSIVSGIFVIPLWWTTINLLLEYLK